VRGYEILSIIGTGGMGIVYEARHHHLRRKVALKTIRAADLADPVYLERFYAEAEAVARLQHPNIIQVFEVGTVEAHAGETYSSPFIALEFVDGGSLAERVAVPQTPQAAAALVEKLARAAHAAHRVGVIHRDLKPANVLLTSAGEPKIADFGVAKQLGAEYDTAGRCHTQAGTVMGTPEYMAPEQAAGAAPTPAVDIYALGVILYELLTARVPFQAASAVETMDLVRSQEPISPRRLRPGLPHDLETICLKCLEKEPACRYASAEALADDLERFRHDRPIQARRVSAIEKARRWCKRNPLAAGLLAAVAVIFLAAFALVTLSYWRSEQARQEVAEQRDEAQRREKAERWERYRANIAASASALQVHNVGSARRSLETAPAEWRNWEWRHFHSRLDLAQHVLPVFKSPVGEGRFSADGRRVALIAGRTVRVWDTFARREVMSFQVPEGAFHFQMSPDGRALAYRSSDREVVLQDIEANRVRAVLRGHERTVHSVQFTADSRRLVTGSHEQALHVWDVRTGDLMRLITLGKHPRLEVTFSADGRRMTSWTQGDAVVRVWDVETETQLVTLPNGKNTLRSVHINKRGDRVLTIEAYPSSTLHLWDVATGRCLSTMRGHSNALMQLAVSPDGTRIASASRDQTVILWEAATGRSLAVLRGHRGPVSSVSFSPDGKRLVSASDDHTSRVWDALTGEALAVLHGHTADMLFATWTADGTTIVSASRDGTVRLWDEGALANNGTLRGHGTFVYGVAFHPDGEQVASASWDGTARIWEATTGRQTALLPHGEKGMVTSVAFHPSGTVLATRARDAVRLWEVASGREVHRWPVPSDGWRDTRVAFTRRGDRLASGCRDREIRIWDVASRAGVAVLRGHEDEVRDVAFSPDGRWLASVADQCDPAVRIWDLSRMEQAHALTGHTRGGYAVAFNSAGTLLASGATDGTVRLWDTRTWKEVAVFRHGINVYGVAFTPDGTRLACACADNTIRIWDVDTHQEVAELRGHTAYVHQVMFSPDGTRLVSASGDHLVRIWDTLPAQERQKKKTPAGGR
jgi:WD40 repeat protein/tRNA A-37 threonylcarbamoyl transferase component Bud32